MKSKLKVIRFNDVLEIQQNLQQVINSITREEFQTCFPVMTGLLGSASALTPKRSTMKAKLCKLQ